MMFRQSIVLALAIASSFAQSKSEFDVATIKPNAEKDNLFMMPGLPQGGAYRATGVTLKMLIMYVYGAPAAFQVTGGPTWVGVERWDIQAKADKTTIDRVEFMQMLRSLIEDRFRLKVRRETKEMPIYELVVAKDGSKLSPHSGDPSKPEDRIRTGFGTMRFQDCRLGLLAYQLSLQLGRQVVDKTGLTGQYDFSLEWAPEPGESGPEAIGLPPDPSVKPPPADPNRPTIFTAIQDQLGLRLASQKGPIDVVVIENAEKPSAN